ELVEAGREVHRIVLVDRTKVLAHVELTDLPSKYPFALGVPQSTTEEVLLRRLASLGGSVRRGHRVDSLRENRGWVPGHRDRGVGPLVSGGDQSPLCHRRRRVAQRGPVRDRLGLSRRDYPSQFVLADVALTSQACANDEAAINGATA